MKAQVSTEFMFYVGIFMLFLLIGFTSIFFIQQSDIRHYNGLLLKEEGNILANVFYTVYEGGVGFNYSVSITPPIKAVFYYGNNANSSQGWLVANMSGVEQVYYYSLPPIKYDSNCKKIINGKEWNYIMVSSRSLHIYNEGDNIIVSGGCE